MADRLGSWRDMFKAAHKRKTPKRIHVLLKARSRHSYCGRHMATAHDMDRGVIRRAAKTAKATGGANGE